MDIENGTHDFTLNKPIMVHFSGKGEQEVICLIMREPTRAHAKKASKLKQMIMRSMMEISEKSNAIAGGEEQVPLHEKTSEDIEKSAEEMREALRLSLMLSEKVDLGDFVETFVSMAVKPGAKKPIIMCDGEVPIKDIHFDQMSADEVEELAIVYASFFHMPSVMQTS